MSEICVNPRQSSLFTATLDEFDTCESLKSMFDNSIEYDVDIQAEKVCFLAKENPRQATQHKQSDAFSVGFTIASPSLNLATLSQILKELVAKGTKVVIQENRFARHFSTFAVDVLSSKPINIDSKHIKQLVTTFRTDIYVKGEASLAEPGLLVMDMDSTIIAMECIDEIAELAGVKEQVAAVTESAMRGEIPFTQSLHDRVACLKGVSVEDLYTIRNRLPFMPNFIEVMRIFNQANWTLAIASGGFTFFADYVKHVAKLDYAKSNVLEVADNSLTGKVVGEVVDGAAKAQVLLQLKQHHDIAKTQVIAMGDGANDLLMMEQAGTSVAYHAKPSVSEQADVSIVYGGFEGLVLALR